MPRVALMLVFLLMCCGSAVPSPVRSIGPGEVLVPTFVADGWLCAGVGFVGDFVLHGSRSDPRVAWLTGPGGERRDLAWLAGSSARFAPELEILDPSGRVIAREGSAATGGCGSPEPGAWFVDFSTQPPGATEPRMTAEP